MPISKEQILAHADRLAKLSSDLSAAKEQFINNDINKIAQVPSYSYADIGLGTISDRPAKNGVSATKLFEQFALS